MSTQAATPVVKVEDIMSSPVFTINEAETVLSASKLMKKNEIGCVVVVNKSGKPIGLMTERDVVRRVAALDLLPSKVKAAKAMTKPPATVDPVASVTDAAKQMRELKIRRLIVVQNGRLKGIITSNDIVDVTPALIDVIAEKSQIAPVQTVQTIKEAAPMPGNCDRCGAWADELKSHDGQFLCEDCLADIAESGEDE